ncbi:MAG: aminopeptidase P family protein [Parvibaculales bacterium]
MFQDFTDDTTDKSVLAARVTQLRRQLKQQKLDGFLVPREDAFQGEYVPAANERLKYMTGFGGSAGMAIILAKKAALFVDGRYELQAPQQTDTALFSIEPLMRMPPAQWLAAQVKKGWRIGIDPRLHVQSSVTRLRAALAEQGAELVYVATNPVDAIWTDRPCMPHTMVQPHNEKLSGQSATHKRATLAAQLKQAGQDAMIIAQPENIAWLLNIRANDVPHTPFALSFGILHKSARFDWFIDAKRVSANCRAHIGKGVTIVKPQALKDKLAALAGKTVRLDPDSTSAWFGEALSGSQIVFAPDLCALPKACKNKAEIRGAIAAHKRDGVALCRFLHWLETAAPKGGVDEIIAAQKAEEFRAATGRLKDLSFDTISGTGPNGAIVHYRVTEKTNRRLRPGDLYLIDSGGQYDDGTTDVTRTVLIGGKAPPSGAIAAFTRVLRGHIALAMARFPENTNGMQLDTLARAPLWAAGQDFDHGTGHGVGSYLSVHEGPQRISKGGTVALQPGMIVSNEPGFYHAGRFGIRIENLQYVTAANRAKTGQRAMLGFEALTRAPIDRRLIDKKMLSKDETVWLNAYHARVLKDIAPKLDKPAQQWLKRACAPL